MIPRTKLPELRAFAKVEESLPLEVSEAYARLVVPTGNSIRPVHQWFKYKEAFSSELLESILNLAGAKTDQPVAILEPFCGVGTTLVSAQFLAAQGRKLNAVGIECNPFSAFVAR